MYFLTMAVLVLIGLNAGKWYVRLDLTEHDMYTISPVTSSLLRQLPENVEITYYVSPELRGISNAPRRIGELLEEYAARGRGRVNLRTVAPGRAGGTETMEELGLEPRQVRIAEQNEERFAAVYSGLVIRYLDRSRVIPFILDTTALEYELTSAISRLQEGEERRLTLLVGRDGRSVEADYRLLRRTLEQHFTVQIANSAADTEIPAETDVLVLLGGADLESALLRRIEEYLHGGGGLLVLTEGVEVQTEEGLAADPQTETPFSRMMERYGVGVQRALVLDEYNRDFRIPHRTGGGTAWESLGPYPYWLSIREASVSAEHPITARFPGLDMLWASPLRLAAGEGVESHELIHSSTRAWTEMGDFSLQPEAEGAGEPEEGTERQRYLLAAVLEGTFPRYFTGSPDAAGDKNTAGDPQVEVQGRPGRMVVFGDTDFASDLLYYSDSYYNTEVLLNSCQWLADDEKLMELRTRRSRDLRLNNLSPEEELAQYRLSQVINLLLVPAAVVLLGLLRRLRRRRSGASAEE
jgi:gliding-associated putative ABC transporter substrate-binding component GldG